MGHRGLRNGGQLLKPSTAAPGRATRPEWSVASSTFGRFTPELGFNARPGPVRASDPGPVTRCDEACFRRSYFELTGLPQEDRYRVSVWDYTFQQSW